MDYSSPNPGSFLHGILETEILEWVVSVLLQGIFPTQGLNPGLLHGRQGLYPLSHQRRQAGCATVYLSIHLLKDILIASKFGQLYIKLLVDVQGYLIVIIISNSLTIYNTEHLFICLFAICLSSLMR